jgi:hypothetical protein
MGRSPITRNNNLYLSMSELVSEGLPRLKKAIQLLTERSLTPGWVNDWPLLA